MDIALIDTAPMEFGGGYENFLLGAASFGAAAGHRMSIVVPTPAMANAISVATTLRPIAKNLSEAEAQRRGGSAEVARLGPFRARRHLRRASVLYCKNEPQEVAFALFARPARAAVVVGFHSATSKQGGRTAQLRNRVYRSPAYRRLFRSVDAIHVLRGEDVDLVVDLLAVDRSRIHLIPNGIDLGRFSPGPPRRSETFRVLFAGRLDAQKGADVLFESIRLVNSDPTSFGRLTFTIAGVGPLEGEAAALADAYQNVDYRGFVPDLRDLYRSVDLLVAPSRWETFGLVAAEAIACSLPAALSSIPPYEALGGSGAAYFPVEDASAMAQVIARLAEERRAEPSRYEERRTTARRFAEATLGSAERYGALFTLFEATSRGSAPACDGAGVEQ